jgi:hypothetical protein
MSILEKLPASYKFTEADVDRGMDTFMKYFATDVTDEEMEFCDFTLKAWEMYCQSKRWPTVTEVAKQFQREAEEYEIRRVAFYTPEAKRKYYEEKSRKAEHAPKK